MSGEAERQPMSTAKFFAIYAAMIVGVMLLAALALPDAELGFRVASRLVRP